MPVAVPDRFRLEVRLGRDDDIEEWLATDTSLDRPVLIRLLGPEAAPDRRREFVTASACDDVPLGRCWMRTIVMPCLRLSCSLRHSRSAGRC